MKIEQYPFFQEVAAFSNKDQYSNWLWEVLCTLNSPLTTKRQHALGIFLNETTDWGDVGEGLKAIYHRLEKDTQQPLFRQSIGNVLAEHGNAEDTPLKACKDLIYLTAGVRAIESVGAFVPTIGNGLLGRRYPDSLFDAIGVLKLLAPAPEVKETTSQLIESANFDNGFILEATGILVRCDPTQALILLDKFTPRFTDLREKVRILGGKEWEAYLKVTDDLAGRIQRLNPAIDPAITRGILLG